MFEELLTDELPLPDLSEISRSLIITNHARDRFDERTEEPMILEEVLAETLETVEPRLSRIAPAWIESAFSRHEPSLYMIFDFRNSQGAEDQACLFLISEDIEDEQLDCIMESIGGSEGSKEVRAFFADVGDADIVQASADPGSSAGRGSRRGGRGRFNHWEGKTKYVAVTSITRSSNDAEGFASRTDKIPSRILKKARDAFPSVNPEQVRYERRQKPPAWLSGSVPGAGDGSKRGSGSRRDADAWLVCDLWVISLKKQAISRQNKFHYLPVDIFIKQEEQRRKSKAAYARRMAKRL